MLFSQFRVLCQQYHAFSEAHENKSDDLPVRHYQTRRINSKVIHLIICSKFRANHFRNFELIINHLFPNSWINTTFNHSWSYENIHTKLWVCRLRLEITFCRIIIAVKSQKRRGGSNHRPLDYFFDGMSFISRFQFAVWGLRNRVS